MTLYCSAVRPSAVAADAGPRVYVVLTGEKLEGKEVRQFAADGARRAASALQLPVHAAIGRVVGSVGRVVESRNDADRVMRVLLGPEAPSTVADIDDVRAQANLLEVLDLVRERPQLQEGGLQRLDQRADDRSRPLLITLRAYLDHSGDVTAAAAAMHVHPNTFRYRLRRACELADLHLEDPTERLMLALQLRVHS
jgi:DNA-binding PucR family transcriptional regulator